MDDDDDISVDYQLDGCRLDDESDSVDRLDVNYRFFFSSKRQLKNSTHYDHGLAHSTTKHSH